MKRPDGEKLRTYYKDYIREKDMLICPYCKNDKFYIYQPFGEYETDTICTKCKKKQIAHDG